LPEEKVFYSFLLPFALLPKLAIIRRTRKTVKYVAKNVTIVANTHTRINLNNAGPNTLNCSINATLAGKKNRAIFSLSQSAHNSICDGRKSFKHKAINIIIIPHTLAGILTKCEIASPASPKQKIRAICNKIFTSKKPLSEYYIINQNK
jgi:hypothetical protein